MVVRYRPSGRGEPSLWERLLLGFGVAGVGAVAILVPKAPSPRCQVAMEVVKDDDLNRELPKPYRQLLAKAAADTMLRCIKD